VNGTRQGGLAGIAFVALTVLWGIIILVGDRPGYDSSSAAISEYWGDSGKRGLSVLAAIALALAGLALLWFLGSLRVILRRAEGEPARLATIAFAGGVVMAALLFVKNSIDGGLALALEFGEQGVNDFTLDPEVFKTFDAFLIGLLIHEAFAAAVLIGAASLLTLRTRIFPRWLGWAGVVVALLQLASWAVYGVPLILALAWILAVSLLMLRGDRTAIAVD
jgi:hypothetical protein